MAKDDVTHTHTHTHTHKGVLATKRMKYYHSQQQGRTQRFSHQVKQVRQRQIYCDITFMWNLKKNDTKELIYKIETNSQTTNFWLPKGKSRAGINLKFEINRYTLLYRNIYLFVLYYVHFILCIIFYTI